MTSETGCCAYCGVANASSVCSRCKTTRYCNRGCQSIDWASHKKICRAKKTSGVGGGNSGRGEVTFTGNIPPQSFIFCGVCDSHFMMCGCTGRGKHGVDFIFKGLPPPPPGLKRFELLRRFASIVAVSPAMRAFSSMEWHSNEAPGIDTAIEARRVQLLQIVEDYIATLATSGMLTNLAAAVGGEPLQRQAVHVQSRIIAKEGRAAVRSFISGDWSTVTLVGCMLIQNAFQSSDPTKYRLDDPHLTTIFQGGIACLLAILQMGYSSHTGWRLALECDRAPCVAGEALESATDRDYFLHNCNS